MLNSFMTDMMAMLMAALPSLLNTRYSRSFNPASIKAVRRSERVIHFSFFTTKVTGDGLDVMIGIHEHGRQQLAVVTAERCIKVDHRRWVVQEAGHQWFDHTRNGSDVLEHLRIRIRIIPLLSIILVGGFLNILVSIVVCGWWNPFIVLHRRFNDMTGNDWTRKKRSKSILYSLVWIIQSTFIQSFMDRDNQFMQCIPNYHPSHINRYFVIVK